MSYFDKTLMALLAISIAGLLYAFAGNIFGEILYRNEKKDSEGVQ